MTATMRLAVALVAVLLHAAAVGGVVQGGDFELPRVSMQRQYRPLYPWASSHTTALGPYRKKDTQPACSEQRQFLVCKGNSCWVKVRVRTSPGYTYRVQYAVDEQVFKGCVPEYCATLPETGSPPLECLPCDKPHGLRIGDVERFADPVYGVERCGVVPVFNQFQVDFEATALETAVTWFPKNISANPRGNFKLDRVSVFMVCGSELVPVDESLQDPRAVCPPTPPPTPAPPSAAPTFSPSAAPSVAPSAAPTVAPTAPPPTQTPTVGPTLQPSPPPPVAASATPSAAPTATSAAPSAASAAPTTSPTAQLTAAPSASPLAPPPTVGPAAGPSAAPLADRASPPASSAMPGGTVLLPLVLVGTVASVASLVAWCICSKKADEPPKLDGKIDMHSCSVPATPSDHAPYGNESSGYGSEECNGCAEGRGCMEADATTAATESSLEIRTDGGENAGPASPQPAPEGVVTCIADGDYELSVCVLSVGDAAAGDTPASDAAADGAGEYDWWDAAMGECHSDCFGAHAVSGSALSSDE
eukprot:TRINITY_DN647_c0_g2_i1.p1 TRINITY_DN647_c0_g2~~TRINITY_DN647_c0_g2_i1.p1  ORF type:complete len:548 (+),score=171.67 TRINITY_DN647_c0_g2_i1:49-1644(+)